MCGMEIESLPPIKPPQHSSLLINRPEDLSVALTTLSSKHPTERAKIWSLVVRCTTLTRTSLHDLCEYLRTNNTNFKQIDLSNVNIGDQGVFEILCSIHQARKSPISSLFLRNVGLTRRGAENVSTVFSCSLGQLQYIDLGNNHANSRGVRALQTGLVQRSQAGLSPLEVDMSGNLVNVELLNSATHIIGAIGAFCGGLSLMKTAIATSIPVLHTFSLIIYASSLLFLMVASATYHACFRLPSLSKTLRKADHCAIFVLIAGTYTPFYVLFLLNEHPNSIGVKAVLVSVWTCAAVGIFRSLLGIDSSRTRSLFALATGWIGLLSYKQLFYSIPPGVVNLVVLGGLAYSVGIVFYLIGKRLPVMHVVWHLAVMFGGWCHYYALWKGLITNASA